VAITDQQKRLVDEYLIDLNGTRALKIASEICIFTNDKISVEVLE